MARMPALADGLMSNGHVGAKHTDLTLTPEQIKVLSGGNRMLKLTDQQRHVLKKSTGVTNVTAISVLPKDTETCTCELVNVGVRTSPNKLEVAEFLFGRDLGLDDFDQDSQRRWDEYRKADERESNIKNPPRHVGLRRQAKSLLARTPNKSAELLEEALRIDSKYELARHDLEMAYLAIALRENAPSPQTVVFLEKALAIANPSDKKNLRRIQQQLERTKVRLSCK